MNHPIRPHPDLTVPPARTAQQVIRERGRHRASARRSGRHVRHRDRRGCRLVRVLARILCLGVLGALLLVVAGGPGSAQAAPHVGLAAGPMLAVYDVPTVVNNATTWLIKILATVATFFLTLGGAKYMSAGGDPSEVERAKGYLKNAAIGYALAVMAPVLLKILQGILGVK